MRGVLRFHVCAMAASVVIDLTSESGDGVPIVIDLTGDSDDD
jgi:hypothetical protein